MQRGPHRSGTPAALLLAATLCGCAAGDFDTSTLFSRPLDVFGKKGGFAYSELQETRKERPITANDLADAGGNCPPPAVAAAPAPPPSPPAGSGDAAAPPAAAPDAPSLLGEPIGLGMSECDVIHRAGQPTTIQIGTNPGGERTAQMTFASGPRPGMYRFEGGRLMQMDRIETPAPPEAAKKKRARR